MKFLLGKKLKMAQIFGQDGKVHPVTVVATAPLTVTQVKTNESDGYTSLQLGFGSKKAKNVSKAVQGHTKNLGNFEVIRELRTEEKMNLGDKVGIESFVAGDIVTVSGVSKGKGFQGVVKRHGFGGGPRSHGQKHSEREPGSIGGGLRTRVPKNMRMGGRMGGDRVTVKNLAIMHVDAEMNQLYIRGAIPGRTGTILEIKG